MENYYEILGVSKDATLKEIKKAYKDVSKECHPDKNPDDKEAHQKFMDASEAYEVLSDPQKRAVYDETGSYAEIKDKRVEIIATLVSSHFMPLVEKYGNHPTANLMDEFKKEVNAIIESGFEAIKANERDIARLERVISRVTCKSEENLISSMLKSKVERITEHNEKVMSDMNDLSEAIVLLDDYGYQLNALIDQRTSRRDATAFLNEYLNNDI